MAQLLFYDNIVALNRERHADLRLKPANGDCSFARDSHFVPLAGTEFYQAAADYPIVFAGDEGEPTPVALLGLREGDNAFVNADGRWRSGTYVPAFVRRYPFVLARGDDSDSDNLTVCVDESYAGFTREAGEGEALFDAEGNQSEMLQRSVEFLQQYLAESERTRAFVRPARRRAYSPCGLPCTRRGGPETRVRFAGAATSPGRLGANRPLVSRSCRRHSRGHAASRRILARRAVRGRHADRQPG